MQQKEKETSSRKRNKWLNGPGRLLMLMLMAIWLAISLWNGVHDGHDLQTAVLDGFMIMAVVLFFGLLLTFVEILPLLLEKYVNGSRKHEKLRKRLVKLGMIDDEGKLDNSPHERDLNIGFEFTSLLLKYAYYVATIFVLPFFAWVAFKGCVPG